MRKRNNRIRMAAGSEEPLVIAPVTKQPESLLEAMEQISEKALDCYLSDEFFAAVALPASYLSERLQITTQQAVMFSLLMDNSEDSNICLSEIGGITGCSTTRLLRFSKTLEGLEEKFYVRIRRGRGCDTYRIPREVIISLCDDEAYEHKKPDIADVSEFFDRYEFLLNEKRAGEISHEMLVRLNEENLEMISDSHFAKSLNREVSDAEDRLLFVHMAQAYIDRMDDCISFHDLGKIYDEGELPTVVKRELRGQFSDLQTKLIENSNDDGLADPDSFMLTEYAKTDVLREVKTEQTRSTSNNLLRADSLTPKTLIYNDREKDQINQLSSLLMPERFKEIRKRLEEAGMRKGFCCLLYGAPGTGKTETVYQLARQTGRDIMQVNVDEIKSCWVGQSEKNIKQLFTRYRNVCKDAEIAPILLFNEADAVLGLRMEGAVRGVEKMENSIQNIILQEMESLDGIMIATTNLTHNLDKAFERRFLYKIKYEKPTEEARCGIWRQMLRGLSIEDARYLASRFDLSGGEIENIVRKHSVAAILGGTDTIDLRAIEKLCSQERIQAASRPRIGF